jgi:hypothetical protein
MQLQYCFDLPEHSKDPLAEPTGLCLCEHPLYGAYQCKDGSWGFLAAVGQHPWPWQKFDAEVCLGSADLPNTRAGLSSYCSETSFQEVCTTLRKLGMTFAPIRHCSSSDDRSELAPRCHHIASMGRSTSNGEKLHHSMSHSVRTLNWNVRDFPDRSDAQDVLRHVAKYAGAEIDIMESSGVVSTKPFDTIQNPTQA